MTATMSAPIDSPALAVEFTTPMPGLSPYTAFSLAPIAGAEGLHALRAAEAEVRLFVLDAAFVDEEYAPSIPTEIAAELGAGDGAELRVLVVANPADDGVHVNLRAPIVLHPATARATQVILDDQRYPMRALLSR